MKLSSISALLLPTALACNHANMARQAEGNETMPFKYIQGEDPPADPATKGYFINHVALMVSDVNRTRTWYSDVLGMRHIFTAEMSPEYTIMYMAHSQGGRNGTGYQTGLEMARDKNNMAGLIEFQQYTTVSDRGFDATPRQTLSHMGLIVDNVTETQARFEKMGVRIIKRAGELDLTGDTENSKILAGGWGFPETQSEQAKADIARLAPALEGIGFRDFMVVADPDGNMFEVQNFVAATI